MTALTRAGWLLSAAVAAVLAGSLLSVHFTGRVPLALLAATAVLCFVRPRWGLALTAALVPIAWFSASQFWNAQVAWAEALACAALTGLGADACRRGPRVPRAVAVPAAVLGAIVLSSLIAAEYVVATREGPAAFWQHFTAIVTQQYLVDRGARALHAGALLLEGLLLFAHAARLATTPGTLPVLSGATAIGAALSSACTLWRLGESAARGGAFWATLTTLVGQIRLHVHYDDFNAAGSYYALALLVAAGVAWTASRRTRPLWIAAAVLAATGLWLTSSRVAVVAVPAAAAAAALLPRAHGGRRQALTLAAVAGGALALLTLVAIVLPQRGQQKSTLLAADIRVGLIETGARMIRAYPAFGVGLAGFQSRSGEFSSPELIAKFPVAVHENAHNNFVQIAAETGLAGGLAFVWTIAAATIAVARRAAARDRLSQLTFAGIAAFVVTMLAGHPLLVPEPGYAFWLLLGAAAGAALGEPEASRVRPRRWTYAIAALAAGVVLTLPLRLAAAVADADFEHLGIGVPPIWQVAPDGVRYREAIGEATLFEPIGAFKLSINPRSTDPVRLELMLDGRVADIVTLQPNRWNEVIVAPRNVQSDERFRRMDLRTVGDLHPPLWITKDEPIVPR